MSTTTISLPTSAVHAVQSRSADNAAEAVLAIIQAIREAPQVTPSPTPGTVFLDNGGCLWLTAENGKLGLICLPPAPDQYGEITVSFDGTSEEVARYWNLTVIHDPSEVTA